MGSQEWFGSSIFSGAIAARLWSTRGLRRSRLLQVVRSVECSQPIAAVGEASKYSSWVFLHRDAVEQQVHVDFQQPLVIFYLAPDFVPISNCPWEFSNGLLLVRLRNEKAI